MEDASSWRLGLLWLSGISLRITVLAIPPVLPAIHDSLGLNEKAIGILTALPVLLLAAATVLGSLIIHQIGARRALLLGLLAIAAAGAARGLGPSVAVLFVMTFVMGCGVAVCQPALPALVAQWFPHRIGLATAAYSNGMLVAEVVAAGLMLPVLVPLLHGSWELGIAFWSIPVAGTALLLVVFTREGVAHTAPLVKQWWPDWQDPQTWRLGLLLGFGQIPYWVSNAFLPDFLRSAGHPEQITASLAALNGLQVPASLLVALLPGVLVQRRWPLIVDGVVLAGGAIGLVTSNAALAPFWAGVLGFTCGLHFVLNLALAPLLAEANDVHRLSAGIFSISYSCAFFGPLIGGAIWDGTGIRATAFIPVMVGALLVSVIASRIDLTRGRSRPMMAA